MKYSPLLCGGASLEHLAQQRFVFDASSRLVADRLRSEERSLGVP